MTTTELALPDNKRLAEALKSPKDAEEIIKGLEEAVRAKKFDVDKLSDRKDIASLARKVSSSKVAWDEIRKGINASLREQINEVDAVGQVIRQRLDDLRDEVKAPLDKWKADEEARIAKIRERLEAFDTVGAETWNLEEITAHLAAAQAVEIDSSWQEFQDHAAEVKATCINTFEALLERERHREAERAELEELRRLKAERDAADAKAAAEREQAEAAEAEKKRKAEEAAARKAEIEREKTAAAERAKAEADAAAAKREQEAAEREAALRAEMEAEKAAAIAREEAIYAAQEQERQRAAEAEAAKAKAAKAAQANKAHTGKVQRTIAAAVMKSFNGAKTRTEVADAVTIAITAGNIPFTTFTMPEIGSIE